MAIKPIGLNVCGCNVYIDDEQVDGADVIVREAMERAFAELLGDSRERRREQNRDEMRQAGVLEDAINKILGPRREEALSRESRANRTRLSLVSLGSRDYDPNSKGSTATLSGREMAPATGR